VRVLDYSTYIYDCTIVFGVNYSSFSVELMNVHCEAKKPPLFCNNFVKSFFIPIVNGTHIP